MTDISGMREIGRMKNRKDFLAVQKGRRLRGPYFLLETAARGDGDGPARVGFTVTRKQGNAVERNRIRRRLREAIRLEPALPFQNGHDYVFVARRDAMSAPFCALQSALRNRIAEAGGHGRKPATTQPVT